MIMSTAISNDINLLDTWFRIKFDAWRNEVISKYPNARVFEARRSKERQEWLYSQGRTRPWKIVTWTLQSKHLEGKAVDIVFLKDWKPTWNWPYDDLIEMAKKYWIDNLKPRETCHFEDNWKTFAQQAPDPDVQALIDDWIFNGEYEPMGNKRLIKMMWKLYNKVK